MALWNFETNAAPYARMWRRLFQNSRAPELRSSRAPECDTLFSQFFSKWMIRTSCLVVYRYHHMAAAVDLFRQPGDASWAPPASGHRLNSRATQQGTCISGRHSQSPSLKTPEASFIVLSTPSSRTSYHHRTTATCDNIRRLVGAGMLVCQQLHCQQSLVGSGEKTVLSEHFYLRTFSPFACAI